MKRAIAELVLGMAASFAVVNTTQAQGWIFFCNYSGGGQTAPVTFIGPAFGGYTDGETIGQPFHADLVYSFDGVTYNDSGITTDFLFPSGTPVASGGGMFGNLSNQVAIPGYTSGPVDFIVLVYNGASYSASTMMTQSRRFEASELATANNGLPIQGFFDNRMTIPLSPFSIAVVPEPATMALGGVGLAALLAFRRKHV